jgi:hypothetical protein
MKKFICVATVLLYTTFAFSQTQQLSQVDAISIFENLTRIKPIKCIVVVFDAKQCIICLADKRGLQHEVFSGPDIIFYKLSLFANTWQIDIQQSVFKEPFKYCEFLTDPEIATVANEPYLYFVYTLADEGSMAGDIETLKFSLFSLNNYQLSSLDYEGDASYDKKDNFQSIKDGKFLNLEALKANPSFLNYLENKAGKSSFIYRPTEKDLDINDPDNFEKKWVLYNPQVIDQLNE